MKEVLQLSQPKIEKISRQIPSKQTICANKKYFDILYAYLQSISDWDEDTDIRTVNKSDVNFSRLGNMFGLSRQTVSTKFKNLMELGLIEEFNSKQYRVIRLDNDLATLVPFETVKLLTDTLNENSISTYVYLFNRYYANKYKPFQFTLEQVKSFIGICTTTRSNDDVITNILFVLEKIGLIKYSLTTYQQENDTFNNIKTIYQLDWLTNILK